MKRAVIGGVIGLLAVGVLAAGIVRAVMKSGPNGPGPGEGFEPMEAVEIVEAREATWQPTADLVGTVFARRSVTVRNELDGVVRFVGFESGEIVEEGRVLLRQDDTSERADLEEARAAVRVAEAGLAQADAQIALAEAEYRRLTGLGPRAVAEVEVDRARTRVETARAERGRWAAEADQARARVAQVEARLEKLTIRAPFRARAGLRTVHEGQYLVAGTDVVVLQEQADTIYLDFAVPQEYAERVRPGTAVLATGPMLGPEAVPIRVVASDATVNRGTRNLRVRAEVGNPRGLLVPGMAVEVRAPVGEPQRVVTIPSTAVRRSAYGNSVFVVSADEAGVPRARQRFVTLGPALGDDVIVREGLAVGERVAAAGSFKLRDGVRVLVKEAGHGPASPGSVGK
jgi:membrane fusion protein (multidrug efflux system)